MSGTSETELVESPPTIAELAHRLEAQREGLSTAHDEIDRLHEKIAEQNDLIDELRQEIVDLHDRTDLRRHVEDASKLKVNERAEICIQTLVNEAQRRMRNGERGSAAMDYNGARKALGGGLADQQLLDALQRAEELVEGPIVRFKKERRSSQKNSRLIVDLEAGELPSRYSKTQNSQEAGR